MDSSLTKYSIIGSFLCLIVVSFLTGCDKNPVRARLADIETFAEPNPDSARLALEAIDPAFLTTRRLKAQHALMLSTALSRSKVKVPNDSLINIAVDYYDRFGPAKENFLSSYYQGRVYQDLGDYESAMQSYLNAESIHSKDIPLRHLTSLYLLKGEIYQHYYDYDKAVEAYRNAQAFALQCDWKSNYFNALSGELAQHIIFEKKAEVDSLIQIMLPFRDEMTTRNRMVFDSHVLQASRSQAHQDSLLAYARAYEDNYSSLMGFPWDLLSTCYTWAGAFSDAERTLTLFMELIDDPSTNLRYLKAYVELTDSLGLRQENQEARVSLQEILGNRFTRKGPATSDSLRRGWSEKNGRRE